VAKLLDIRTYPDPVLRADNAAVSEITDELRELVRDMVETMYEKDGVGLAAPQVGENIRLITVDPTGPRERKELLVLFNPEIVERGPDTLESSEGCLSVPAFTGQVERCETLTVTGVSADGEAVRIEAEGYLAVILQHEIDHLEGTLILDYAGRLKRAMYDKKVKKWQKQGRVD
jgi:peptide deformylase